MAKSGREWHTIGEASRSTTISRDTLRTACDTGRLPSKRSEKGYRLIPEGVVQRLRQHGLKAFPPLGGTASARVPENEGPPRKIVAVERLGLLGEPSPKLKELKERVEAAKMDLECDRATRDLERLRRAYQEEDEELAQRQEEAQEEDLAAVEQDRLERTRIAAEQRRNKWFIEQAQKTMREISRRADREGLDIGRDSEALAQALHSALTEALRELDPEAEWYSLYQARRRAAQQFLEPFRWRSRQLGIVESVLRNIESHLHELLDGGWLALPSRNVALLAQQLEIPMRSILEREIFSRNLTRTQAEEVLREAIDRRLRII